MNKTFKEFQEKSKKLGLLKENPSLDDVKDSCVVVDHAAQTTLCNDGSFRSFYEINKNDSIEVMCFMNIDKEFIDKLNIDMKNNGLEEHIGKLVFIPTMEFYSMIRKITPRPSPMKNKYFGKQ